MRKYFMIVHILLAAAFLYFSIQVFSRILESGAEQAFPAAPAESWVVASQPSAYPPLSHYRVINRRNLFNTGKTAVPEVARIDLASLKETKLSLKLWGTVTGPKDKAYAVIEDLKERSQNLYRVGDVLQNATLKFILREKVVLNFNGKDEMLSIKAEPAVGLVVPPPAVQTGRAVIPELKRVPSGTFQTGSAGRKRTVRSPQKDE